MQNGAFLVTTAKYDNLLILLMGRCYRWWSAGTIRI